MPGRLTDLDLGDPLPDMCLHVLFEIADCVENISVLGSLASRDRTSSVDPAPVSVIVVLVEFPLSLLDCLVGISLLLTSTRLKSTLSLSDMGIAICLSREHLLAEGASMKGHVGITEPDVLVQLLSDYVGPLKVRFGALKLESGWHILAVQLDFLACCLLPSKHLEFEPRVLVKDHVDG